MEIENTSPHPRFPTARRGARAIFSRRTLYALIVLITLFALFHAEENYRGKRAWDRYRRAAEARGVNFDFGACIPPPVSDEQNAAANSVVGAWFPKPPAQDPNWPALLSQAELRISSRKKGENRRPTERFTDLVALKEALAEEQSGKTNRGRARTVVEADRPREERAAAAPAVLEALNVYRPALDELRAASRRPHVRYPIVYKVDDPFSILLPHLAKVKGIVQELRIQSSAELAAGRVDDAFADVMLMLWLTDSMREEPFLIDHLVRIACLHVTMQPIWEGLAQHQWTDEQLKRLEGRLQEFDFVADMLRPLAAERAASVSVIHRLGKDSHSRPGLTELFDVANQPPLNRGTMTFLTSLVPRGWFHFETLNYCTFLDDQMRDGFDLQKRTINSQKMNENNEGMERAFGEAKGLNAIFRHHFFAKMLLPAMKNATRKFALGQVSADQAALACALERYRLAHGKLPERLEALAPKFITKLPHDVLTGAPLKYERVSDGDFVLSSVGWPAEPKDRPGDWIWRSAAP